MRVLLIEDDPRLGPTLKKLLRQQSYSVELINDGLKGKQKALEQKYDIIILDLNLPNLNGFEICKGVRESKISTPILMLTARVDAKDKICGLDTGADDYLTKPFNVSELFARMRALLRRPEATLPTKLEFGEIILNPANHSVFRGNTQVNLMPKEFSLLEYLLRNSDRVVTRDELLRHVWGVYSNNSSNRLEVYVRYLRNKIDSPFPTNYINTVRGTGYKLAK